MHRATPSSSSAASSSSQKSRRHRFTREQLLKSLEILGPLTNALPPELPPSPPASRPTSPAPASKRKLDADFEQGHSKRPRMSASEPTCNPLPSSSHPQRRSAAHAMRSDPSEDGELRDEPPIPRDTTAASSSNVPVRRPRRGKGLSKHFFDDLYFKYHAFGRTLKWSAENRFWATYPTKHPRYQPLPKPPHPSSPYHKHGHMFTRLELVEALMCFTYAFWARDYGRKACFRSTWVTIESFLAFCKERWTVEGLDDREKAFLGLIWMVEAFIHGRKFVYSAKAIHLENERLYKKLQRDAEEEALREAASKLARDTAGTPAMLPSPASIVNASSANSTPTSRQTGTPDTANGPNNSSNASNTTGAENSSSSSQQRPPAEEYPPDHITVSVNGEFMHARKAQSGGLSAAHYCMSASQRMLTIPIMAKHFPRTFARMVHSSLSSSDEHEPDFEDEEGELLWPGQLVTGEGLGWIATMGRAMIWEFGKPYGYQGIDGASLKPEDGTVATVGGTPLTNNVDHDAGVDAVPR